MAEHLFQEYEIMTARMVFTVRKTDDAGQDRRYRHDSRFYVDIIFLIQCHIPFIPFQKHGNIQALGCQEREWMEESTAIGVTTGKISRSK